MRPRSRVPRGVLVATGAVVLVVAGIAGYLSFGYSLWVAVAMTLLTLTTVGFAPGSHLSTGVLVFTAGLAFLGVGLFFVILGLAATAIVEGRVSLFSRSRRMRRRLDELRGHFIEKTGHALIGARQWIPREHLDDPVKSLLMGLPADLEFRTKGQLATGICASAYADGIRFDFACGNEVYGNCTQLREFFETRGQAYVLRVPPDFTLTLAAGTKLTCAEAVKALLKQQRRWEVRSAGGGAKGERWYAWAWIATASPRHHLLVRRHIKTGELAFHYCHVPEGQLLTKTRLIRAAGLRWPVEEDFEFGKACFGLDQRQTRLHTAILRHAVLVMAALAICAVTAAQVKDRTDTQAPPPVRPDQPPPPEPGMIPLTIPEIKRLLAALTTRPLPPCPVARHPLGHMDPPPPGPLTMVPQTRQTRPRRRNCPGQLAECGCRTRRSRFSMTRPGRPRAFRVPSTSSRDSSVPRLLPPRAMSLATSPTVPKSGRHHPAVPGHILRQPHVHRKQAANTPVVITSCASRRCSCPRCAR